MSFPVVTVSIQRTPVADGASGLQYAGRLFNSWSTTLSTKLCSTTLGGGESIRDVMPGSISTATPMSTASIPSYIQGKTCTSLDACVKGKIPGQLPNFAAQLEVDKRFYQTTQEEYCYYEVRYKKALTDLLANLASGSNIDSTAYATVISLNNRLNSILQIVNAVANQRATMVDQRASSIQGADHNLREKIDQLEKQREFLQSSDVRIRTQEEMIRYSAEKNRAMNIQIVFFVALNVVALGTILTVYTNLKPPV